MLFAFAILDGFLYIFIKNIKWLYGREGPIHTETFTDSEVLEKKAMKCFLMRIIIALINYLIVSILEYKLTLCVFSLSQNVFSLFKQDSIRQTPLQFKTKENVWVYSKMCRLCKFDIYLLLVFPCFLYFREVQIYWYSPWKVFSKENLWNFTLSSR